MPTQLIRYQRDKNSEELYATPPNGKCPIERYAAAHLYYLKFFNRLNMVCTYAHQKPPSKPQAPFLN